MGWAVAYAEEHESYCELRASQDCAYARPLPEIGIVKFAVGHAPSVVFCDMVALRIRVVFVDPVVAVLEVLAAMPAVPAVALSNAAVVFTITTGPAT